MSLNRPCAASTYFDHLFSFYVGITDLYQEAGTSACSKIHYPVPNPGNGYPASAVIA